jgi:hypothetical protein
MIDRSKPLPIHEFPGLISEVARLKAALDEIERLQRIISEPVESFGTQDLVAWTEGLQKILLDFPEEERGQIPFVVTMGSHLEKFAKSWNSPVIEGQAERISVLEEDNHLWREYNLQLYNNNRRLLTALKKLGEAKRKRGKALVEERAHCYLNLERNADIVPWDLNEVSENEQKRLRYDARGQLRREGKL